MPIAEFNPSYPSGVDLSAVNLASMDVESALMLVQTQRATILENQLKDQMLAVQKRNTTIQTLNNLLTAVRDNRPEGEATDTKDTGSSTATIQVPTEDYIDAQQAYVDSLESSIANAAAAIEALDPTDESYAGNLAFQQSLISINTTNLEGARQKLEDMKAPDAPAMWDASLNATLHIYGFTSGNLTQGDYDTLINSISSRIDGLNSSQQLDMLRLQSMTNKRNEAFDIMTNFVKKMQDSRSSIVGNMR